MANLDEENPFQGGNKELSNFWGSGSSDSPALPGREVRKSQAVMPDFDTEIASEYDENEEAYTIDDLLNVMLDKGASDLHLSSKTKPMIRVNGDMTPLDEYPILTSEQIRELMYPIMKETHRSTFERTHELDFAHAIPGRSRFRVNMLQQRQQTGAVIRAIPNVIKPIEALGLPEELNKFAYLPRGLVLVTGPTGSGKSTTLAAIIDRANRSRKANIITIEDPIEFSHENKNSVISQREIGVDTDSFSEALKHALRQDPDIILVGEMRDLETISTAITAAETGHLVFGTLHTQSAAETISRIIDVFPDGSKEQVRQQLGSTIQGIVCQTLVKTRDGKRAAALEIMKGTPGIRNLIRKNQIAQIRSYIETGSDNGMQTMDQHLIQLVEEGRVKLDIAAEKSYDMENFYNHFGDEEKIRDIRRREDENQQAGKGNNALGTPLGGGIPQPGGALYPSVPQGVPQPGGLPQPGGARPPMNVPQPPTVFPPNGGGQLGGAPTTFQPPRPGLGG